MLLVLISVEHSSDNERHSLVRGSNDSYVIDGRVV